MQGGLSSGYKKLIEEKGLNDETYTVDGVALIQISGVPVHDNKAVQVDAVCLILLPFLYCIISKISPNINNFLCIDCIIFVLIFLRIVRGLKLSPLPV